MDHSLPKIDRLAAVFTLLSDSSVNGVSFGELTETAGMTRTGLRSFVDGLVQAELIDYDRSTERYFVGTGFRPLLGKATELIDLRSVFSPLMHEIAEKTEDTVHLSLRCGSESLCILRRDGAYPIKAISLRPGDRRPLGIGTGSLTLLAFADPDTASQHLQRAADRQQYQVDELVLHEEIRLGRQRGYVFNRGFIIPGMFAVGLPIYNSAGEAFAAISVSGIAERMNEKRAESIVRMIGRRLDKFREEFGHFYDAVTVRELERLCQSPDRQFAAAMNTPQTLLARSNDRGIDRFLAILRALAASAAGLRSVDLAQATGMTTATTHRLLLGMDQQGIVQLERGSERRYGLGLKTAAWSFASLRRHGLGEASLGPAEALSQFTGDVVYVGILAHQNVECLHLFEGKFPIRAFIARHGQRLALESTSLGKAILAEMESNSVDELLAKRGVKDGKLQALRAELAECRSRGFAIQSEASGVTSIASAIRGRQGAPIGVIGLSGVSTRFDESRLPILSESLRNATSTIERQLGVR